MSSSKPDPYRDDEDDLAASFSPRTSTSSTSTTSLILDRINPGGQGAREPLFRNKEASSLDDDDDVDLSDLERAGGAPAAKAAEKSMRRIAYIMGALLVGSWLLALGVYLSREAYRFQAAPHNPDATALAKPGKSITLEQVQSGVWRPRRRGIAWIAGERDGLMLVPDAGNGAFLEVQDVRNSSFHSTLLVNRSFTYQGALVGIGRQWPSPDLQKVLVASDVQSVS